MSRVAKAPIVLPTNVEFTLDEKATTITIKGPKGALTQHYNKLVNISKDADSANKIIFAPMDDHPNGWAHSGTARANMKNMIKGVTEGFTITLELVGVGYRAQAAGTKVNLSLGFSHPVDYELPKGITAEFPNNTTIVLHGIDKQLLGQTASEIRSYRPPEPYKGKGIKYAGEVIVRKEAKKK